MKQWVQLDLNDNQPAEKRALDQVVSKLNTEEPVVEPAQSPIQSAQQGLFKNFNKIDPVQLEVARKLCELQEISLKIFMNYVIYSSSYFHSQMSVFT